MNSTDMLAMKKWAVVGATEEQNKFGYRIYKKLKDHGYTVYPVSVKYDEIDGDKAYKNLSDLPEKVDVVDFVVNPKIGLSIIEQCKELGIEHVWLQPGTASTEILDYAKENQIAIVEGCVLVSLGE
ncbi:CoA-binding protein [Vallitalea pronyensis]|uniref:CoA-binding protein n=1 Tax=Vallitalea pronyensis TaxID=1348613 RepID=A0A8J8MN13_9FIRM|nr:CoA-binding protein [Vallitalea pronyensis]QUI24258.1 CoA-binding protein [Vallitalea pronyensis]